MLLSVQTQIFNRISQTMDRFALLSSVCFHQPHQTVHKRPIEVHAEPNDRKRRRDEPARENPHFVARLH